MRLHSFVRLSGAALVAATLLRCGGDAGPTDSGTDSPAASDRN